MRALLGALQQTTCGLVADAGAAGALDHVDEADAVRLAAERHAALDRWVWGELSGRLGGVETASVALEEALRVASRRCNEVPLHAIHTTHSFHTQIEWLSGEE